MLFYQFFLLVSIVGKLGGFVEPLPVAFFGVFWHVGQTANVCYSGPPHEG